MISEQHMKSDLMLRVQRKRDVPEAEITAQGSIDAEIFTAMQIALPTKVPT